MEKRNVVERIEVAVVVLMFIAELMLLGWAYRNDRIQTEFSARIEEQNEVIEEQSKAIEELRNSDQGNIVEHKCEVLEVSTTEIIIEDFTDENLFDMDYDSELSVGDTLDVLFADHNTESRTDDEIIAYYRIQ